MDFPLKDREKIKELLIQMNKLLTDHIEIHNAIFNPPLRAKIPLPFIMKKIDFKKQSEKALQINNSVDEHLKVAFVMNKFSKMNNSTYQTIYDHGQSFLLSSMKLSEIAH
ncbi:hypothetical protein [Cytobacillus praedii]|uniref:hypothetical protein n=1 Tax=Cytobacillus praedii TaxID=1742358 RepID=UPI002E1E724B|nr:hypothetical protein [Cytobacillus praedii]